MNTNKVVIKILQGNVITEAVAKWAKYHAVANILQCINTVYMPKIMNVDWQ